VEAISHGLKRGFLKFDSMLEQKMPPSGSCAIVVTLVGDYLFIANAGDSRALLIQETCAFHMLGHLYLDLQKAANLFYFVNPLIDILIFLSNLFYDL
jgi:hypothetical protein